MTNYKLSQIIIYPVKSLPGISLKEAEVEERGLKYDRRWMLIDKDNQFLTQRKLPQMALVNVNIIDKELIFNSKKKIIPPLKIALAGSTSNPIVVKIWDDECEANQYGNEVNDWFSEVLEFKCRLVYMPNTTNRKTSTKYYGESKNVSFADGYPLLIIGEEALNNLNNKLETQIKMNRFRPNLVFTGGKPHDEDAWKNFNIGKIGFTSVKPCARCVITTINTETAKKGKEPLTTLSSYRLKNNKVLFGQNVVSHASGNIQAGAQIILTEL